MRSLPFLLRRPVLLIRGLLLNRNQPDLDRLRATDNPDDFGWMILPHVARSFATSILWLPKSQAHAARVGYLYARMLDTYEDMALDDEQRRSGLRWFATRFASHDFSVSAPQVSLSTADRRDEVYRLLVERCQLVDQLFLALPESDRESVAVMVGAMASSMEAWAMAFESQGGVLQTAEQLDQYCDDVIGEPARFAVSLMVAEPLSAPQSEQISKVSEFIQLANITRDIERDLLHGVAYHPALLPYLKRPAEEAVDIIGAVRKELLVRALRRAPAFTRLLNELPLPMFSAARGSAVVMLMFTDRYYRRCAGAAGQPTWPGSDSTLRIVWSSLLALVSSRWTRRLSRRIEMRMLAAADTIASCI